MPSSANIASQSYAYDIIHIVTRADVIGGVHIHIIDLCLYSTSKGLNICVVSGGIENSPLALRLSELNIPHVIISSISNKISLSADIRSILNIADFLGRYKPKIVSIHSSKVGLTARIACILIRQKFIFTVHGWSFSAFVKVKKFYIFRLLEYLLSFATNNYVIISRNDLKIARYSLSINNNAINFIQNTSTFENNALLYSNYNKGNDHFLKILSVGRLDSQKDQLTIINSLAGLSHYNNWHLDIVGDGPLMDSLVFKVKKLNLSNFITFHGFISDVSSYYTKADLFVQSSFYEGLPLTILEALSYGLPIFASDIPGCREMVIDNVNGKLFSIRNYFQLRNLLVKCLESNAYLDGFGDRSRLIYDRLFSHNLFFQKHLDLYSKFIPSINYR